MFFQVKTLRVEEGHSDKIVEKFASKGLIEEQPGFIDMNILRKNSAVEMRKWWSSFAGNRKKRGKLGRKVTPI